MDKNGKPIKPGDDKDKDKDKKQGPERQQYQGNSVGRYFGKNFLGDMFQNVYVSGGTSLTSRSYSVDGSQSAQTSYKDQYTSQGFGTQQVGPFQQNMDLTVNGRVFDAFSVNGRFTNTRQGNYFNQVFGLNYKAKGTSFAAGDVAAALPGNEFANFTRTVRGLSFGRDFGNGMRIQAVGSYTQAVARRGNFQGNGTKGPYQLQSSSILEGSERVQQNGVDLVAGQDYTIDYLLGQITFIGGKIINPEDTIVYTYEAQNYNSSPGLLTGLRYDLSPKAMPYSMGFTWVQQKSLDGNNGVQEITERFPINDLQTYQYTLAAGIENGSPVEVRYLDQILVENVDYQLVRASRFFRLLRKFPPDTAFDATVSLSIKYRPVKQTSLTGDRSVYGLDGAYKIAQNTSLNWQYGRSQNTVQGAKGGDALSMNASFGNGSSGAIGGWTGTLGYRNIGSSYAGIDSVSSGLLRAENGLRGTLQYRPTSFLSVTTSMNQSRVGNSITNTATDGTQSTAFSWNKNTQLQGGFSLSLPRFPRLDYSHSQIEQKQEGGTSASHYQSDQVNMNYQLGMLGLTGSLGHTASRGQSVFTSGFTNALSTSTNTGGSVVDQILNTISTSSNTDSASDTGRLSMSLTPASWISLSAAMGLAKTSYGSTGTAGAAGTSSNARDTTLGVRLPVRSNLSFGVDWSNSTNGQGNTTTSSQTGYGIAAQNTSTISMDMRYQPKENMEFSLLVGRTKYIIPGYDNTDTNNRQFSFTYAPMPQITLVGLYSNNMVRYLGSQSGTSNDNTYQFQASAGPFPRLGGALGRITFSSSWQSIKTGSALYTSYTGDGSDLIGTTSLTSSTSTQTAFSGQQQNMNLWTARADYPVGQRQSIYLSWQAIDSRSPAATTTTASSYYTASNYQRGNGSIGYDFKLNEFMGLTFDWSLIQMRDRERSDQSYRARALNVDLNARF